MVEYEKKIILSEDEYLHLRKTVFANSSNIVHKNYYYDTADLKMNKNGITCRIRECDGVFYTLIKDHNDSWGDCSIENLHGMYYEYNDVFFLKAGLTKLGYNITERLMLKKENLTLFLDKTEYLGTRDYELEIEYNNGFDSDAKSELFSIGNCLLENNLISDINAFISRNYCAQSKSSRFFSKLKKIF